RARASAPSASHHDVNGSGSRIVPARPAPAYMTAGMPAITNSHQPAGTRHTANLRKKRISPTRPWWKSTRTTPAMPGEYTARIKSGFATLISPKRAKTASGKTMTSRAIPHVKPQVIARNCAIGLALAHPGDRQPGIAFELTKRLPLRRRNLTEPLLFDLCVRAFAKHASGQQTGAQRDLERVYSIDPGFPFVKIAQELMAPSNV